MTEGMIGFILWVLVGVVFLGYGIFMLSSKRRKAIPFGFWANAKVFPVKDVTSYNKAVAKLWIVFSVVFMFLGVPMLSGQNSPLILLSIVGTMVAAIITMAIYVMVIEKKYRDTSK